jgi:hypothetical protein
LARPCDTCRSPDRDAIDRALVAGEPIRRIAARYPLSASSVGRHRAHISPAIVRAALKREEQEERRAASLLDRVENLYDEAREVLETAKANEQGAISINAIRELRSTLELIGRLTGEINERPQVVTNVLIAPEWLAVRTMLLDVLAPFPEARAALSSRLRELEAPSTTVERVG